MSDMHLAFSKEQVIGTIYLSKLLCVVPMFDSVRVLCLNLLFCNSVTKRRSNNAERREQNRNFR